MNETLGQMQQATAEVRQAAVNWRLRPPAAQQHAICRCSRRSKGRSCLNPTWNPGNVSLTACRARCTRFAVAEDAQKRRVWPHNDPESGE
jgi:hypothetical protein